MNTQITASRRPLFPRRSARRSRFALLWAIGFLVLVSTLFAWLAAPAAAATGDFVITGRGWGHGRGMSQWGAWAAAREGATYQEILAFYYPGTSFGHADNKVIKVRITRNTTSSGGYSYYRLLLKPKVTPATLVVKDSSGESTSDLDVGDVVDVTYRDGKVRVAGVTGSFDWVEVRPQTTEGRVAVTLLVTSSSDPSASSNQREYWGKLQVTPNTAYGKLNLYNYVLLEHYLRSIRETETGWADPARPDQYAPEAMKAQIVASRSYALARHSYYGYICDNTSCQIYSGYTYELPGIIAAVEATTGQVVTYGGKPIYAEFHAHNGGYTKKGSAVYFPAKPDPWSLKAPTAPWKTPPGWPWTKTMSPQAVTSALNLGIGTVTDMKVIARDTADPDSHAVTVRVTGTSGSKDISAATLKGALNLGSTLILTITKEGGGSATVRYEQNDSRLAYSGTWTPVSTPYAYGGSFRYANSSGSSVNVAFSGTYIAWIAKMSPVYGKAKLILDGGAPETIDLYAPSEKWKQKVWEKTLPDGPHTLRIEWTGLKNSAATNTNISVDAFEIIGALTQATLPPSPTRYEQNDSRLAYSGTWTPVSTPYAYGGSFRYANSSGSSVNVAFSGTYIAWIAKMSPVYGKAKLILDGGAPETIDLYAPSEKWKQKVWEKTLPDGPHTLRIEWTGLKNSAATNTNISVDAFEVLGTLTQATSGSGAAATRYEQDNSKLAYSGTWLTFYTSGASGGSYKYADSPASVTITFSGTRLDWIATKGYTQGKALVSLNGGPGVKVNLYNSTTQRQVPVWSTGTLAAGTHTVTIRWTGEPGAAGGGTRVNVDAVEVVGSLN